jgi:8-oxo-dGTP pyrophosphatase MutT (NUDIX family)
MLYHQEPENFKPKFEVVGNFVQYQDEIILLLRQNHKRQGNTWGIPSGKVDDGENLVTAACRETFEETGLVIPEADLEFFKTAYVRYDDYDFIYHMFSYKLDNKIEVTLSDSEHQAVKWIKVQEAFSLPLIEDLDECLRLFFKI